MTGPRIEVQLAPTGWTHLGGPGVHILVHGTEEDQVVLDASDAADTGDLHAVYDTLMADGYETAHSFAGMNWADGVRVIVCKQAYVVLTVGGRRLRLRAPEGEAVDRSFGPEVEHLKICAPDDSAEPDDDLEEFNDEAYAEALAAEPVATPSSPAPSTPSTQAVTTSPPAPVIHAPAIPPPTWGQPAQRPAQPPEPEHAEATPPAPSDVLRAIGGWGAAPALPDPPGPLSPLQPVDMPAEPAPAPVPDVESTWAVRPGEEPPPVTAPETDVVPTPPSAADAGTPSTASPAEPAEPESPTYDWLFGQTSTFSAMREATPAPSDPTLATPDGPDPVQPHEDPAPAVPADDKALTPRAQEDPASRHVSPQLAPTPAFADQGLAPSDSGDGLISSVPWVRRRDDDPPDPAPEPFHGVRTPPPAPRLRPAMPETPLHTPQMPRSFPPPAAGAEYAAQAFPPPVLGSAPAGVDLPPPPGYPASDADPAPDAPQPPSTELAPPAGTHSGHTPHPGAPGAVGRPLIVSREHDVSVSMPEQPVHTGPNTAAAQADTPPVVTSSPTIAPPDDLEATVDRSAVLANRAPVAGPAVLAVLCAAGHASPPHLGSCRRCGRPIPEQQPYMTPRPALGIIRLSTGDAVTLDRGVVLGRSPKVCEETPLTDRPHVLKVPSPEKDISRNHAEIILEGWHVLVRDLGSTNGTIVTLPGGEPTRLRAGDQQVIEPGTRISLADEVDLVFEVEP